MFDKVQHDGLWYELKNSGINGNLLDLISLLLTLKSCQKIHDVVATSIRRLYDVV